MTEKSATVTALEEQIQECKRVIAKNQRLARTYNANIREAKRRQKELGVVLRKAIRDEKKALAPPKPQNACKGVDSWTGKPCKKKAFSEYCGMHNPDRKRCSADITDVKFAGYSIKCEAFAIKGYDFCGKHVPPGEMCNAKPHRYGSDRGRWKCPKTALPGITTCAYHRDNPDKYYGREIAI